MSTSFDKEYSGASLLPNIAMAFCHLSYLDPHASEFFFVGIDDAKKGRPIKVWGNVSFTAVQSELVTYNQEGYGIYVTVNEIDHSGSRKESNVTRIRSIFEDNDTVGAAPVSYTIQPSFEVESSPGKFHRYWLNSDSVSMNEFKEMAKSLVRTCGSDPACKDPPRVLRLAGFYHCKKIPVMTVLREAVYDQSKNTFLRYEPLNTALNPGECTKLVRYRCEALKTAFPPLQPDEAESPLCYDYSHISLGDEEPRIFGAVTALSTDCAILLEYDPWLRCGMALHSALPDGRGCDLWKIASSGLPNYDEAEIHPRKNELVQALGINERIVPEINEVALRIFKGDKFILCSDGLSGMINDNEIFDIANANDPVTASNLLVNVANDKGGTDNITVQVISIIEGDILPVDMKNIPPVGALDKNTEIKFTKSITGNTTREVSDYPINEKESKNNSKMILSLLALAVSSPSGNIDSSTFLFFSRALLIFRTNVL